MKILSNNLIFNSACQRGGILKNTEKSGAVSSAAMTVFSSLKIGILGGMADFAWGSSVSTLCDLAGVSSAKVGLRLVSLNGVGSVWVYWIENCMLPILEEVLFRGLIQEEIKKRMQSLLDDPTKEVDLGLIKLPIASLISVVATALLFGFAHCLGVASIIQVIVCTTSGLLFGLIKEHNGLAGSISAHVVSNLLV